MKRALRTVIQSGLIFGLATTGVSGCDNSAASDDNSGSASEVATSVVSGALNNSTGSTVGWNDVPAARPSIFERAVEQLSPIATAHAATWMCSGDTLSPAFDGAAGNPYAFTPVSCTVDWRNGKSASSKWSGSFTLDYGASCDTQHARLSEQAGGCSLTRTTASGGNTRTVTGPDGNAYAVTHDTNGAGSGWDSTVAPAPGNGGVIATCATAGCASGGSLVISGSHLTGTETPHGGAAKTIWDHTVSTGAQGLTVAASAAGRVVNGAVTVEHNLRKYTATAKFDNVEYSEPGCCFPTSGTVTSTYEDANKSRTESLTFSAICGEATFTNADGQSSALTLQHCL
jgi:hypothetical protein